MKSRLVAVGLLCCLLFGSCGRVVDSSESGVIASGNMYEVTENNFVSGLEYEFTSENLKVLNSVIPDDITVLDGKLDKNNIKYMVNLYDSTGKELYEYAVDENLRVYDGNLEGKEITCSGLEGIIRSIIGTVE